MDLNKIVDKIYIICIPERKNNIIKIMNKLNVNFTIINAILKDKIDVNKLKMNGFNKKLKAGNLACHLSHKKAVKTFLQSGARNCIIFEDDIRLPTAKEIEYYYKCKNDLQWLINREDLWSIIYLGKCWNSCLLNKKIRNNLFKAWQVFCTHSYILNRKSAKKFLTIPNPLVNFNYTNLDIDLLLKNKFSEKIVLHPSLFFQNNNKSTLNRNQKILKFLNLDDLDNSGGLQCYSSLLIHNSVIRIFLFLIFICLIISIIVMIIKYKKKI